MDHVIKNDEAKWMLIPVKMLLQTVCFWPENQTKFTRTISIFIFVNFGILVIGIIGNALSIMEDIAELTVPLSSIAASVQGFFKLATMLIHHSTFESILRKIRFEFWPSHLMTNSMKMKMVGKNRRFKIMFTMFLVSWPITVMEFFLLNLISGNRKLPADSEFLFDWTRSPVYELLYIWQYIISMTIAFCIMGSDFLFMTIVDNCSSQIYIINSILKCLDDHLNDAQKTFLLGDQQDDFKTEVMRKCIHQHETVIAVMNEMQEAYGSLIFFQFISSMCTASLFSLIVTLQPEELTKILFIFMTILFTLFLYCWIATQLTADCTTISDAAYSIKWYRFSNMKLKKAVLLIMQRGQYELKLSGYGIMELTLVNFMAVLKFSFSFYTLLKTVVTLKQ